MVVEYGEREQRISITDGFYKSNRYALKIIEPVVLQRQVMETAPAPEAPASNPNATTLNSPTAESRANLPHSDRIKRLEAPATEKPLITADSTQSVSDDRFKSNAPRADYQVRGEFDNSYVFRLLSEYQAIGWEVSMMEFGVGSKQLHGDKVMMIILRRAL